MKWNDQGRTNAIASAARKQIPVRASFFFTLSIAPFACFGCDYPEFTYRKPSSSAATTASSKSALPVTVGASTGSADQDCAFGVSGACGEGKKCALVDVKTGGLGCITAGPKTFWQTCGTDADCREGALCDPRYGACKPVCKSASDCQFEIKKGDKTSTLQGNCIEAESATGTAIAANIKHCTSHCEPIGAAPCDFGNEVTCVERLGDGFVSNGFDCAKSKGLAAGAPCGAATDCAPGRLCVVLATMPSRITECALWCDPLGASNPACPKDTNACVGFDPPAYYGETEYGTCEAP